MWLNKIIVTQAAEDSITGYNGEGRRVTIKNLKNCVVIDQPEGETKQFSDTEPAV
jgi:hypothetical protein